MDCAMIKLYNIFTKETIIIEDGSLTRKCKELDLDYTAICHLKSKRRSSAGKRFILDENRSCLFTLVDIDTLEEFDCIHNWNIFTHLNLPYHENEAKYVYELRKCRQATASIGGRVFVLKKDGEIISKKTTKNFSKKVEEFTRERKILNKIANNIRRRTLLALKRHKAYKCTSTFKLLQCSREELVKYLESKFQEGMSWENHGLYGWHIDHIIPCASFDLSDPEQQKVCFHYTNLQPLWAKDNLTKNRKRHT